MQLLRAVLHMHAAGFCHRDIKPENCMVERKTHRLKVMRGEGVGGSSGGICRCWFVVWG